MEKHYQLGETEHQQLYVKYTHLLTIIITYIPSEVCNIITR